MVGMTAVPEGASPWVSLVLDQRPYFFVMCCLTVGQ